MSSVSCICLMSLSLLGTMMGITVKPILPSEKAVTHVGRLPGGRDATESHKPGQKESHKAVGKAPLKRISLPHGGEGSESLGINVSRRNSPDVGHRLLLLAHMNCFCNPPTALSAPSLYPSNNLLVSLMISKHRAGLVTVECVWTSLWCSAPNRVLPLTQIKCKHSP